MIEVAVLGLGAFVPGYGGLAAWSAGESNADLVKASGHLIPARQRRRASGLSRALADAYAESLEQATLDATRVASVFGSALGESATMIGLLDQMWDENAALSPMKFATSVHNAASGTVSIATKNRGYTTSIGADYDTPAMSLIEGISWVAAHDENVIVCCGDEQPPPDLVPDGLGWGLLSAAIALGPRSAASAHGLGRLSLPSIETATSEPLRRDAALERNPCIGLLDLVHALSSRSSGTVALDRGQGRGYATRIWVEG
jgi:hypothetical protein